MDSRKKKTWFAGAHMNDETEQFNGGIFEQLTHLVKLVPLRIPLEEGRLTCRLYITKTEIIISFSQSAADSKSISHVFQ